MSNGAMNGMAWLDNPSPERKPRERKRPEKEPLERQPLEKEPPEHTVHPLLRIDGQNVNLRAGDSVLEAARRVGVTIPTLCHREGLASHTSCMVCLVRDLRTNRFIPACTARAEEGMDIDASSADVRAIRRRAIELLLSEHAGDCEGPCTRICPAHMNIPLMIRQIRAGALRQALMTIKRDIPLPAVLGRICPAPCEKGCHRAAHDDAVAICMLKRFAADADLAAPEPWLPSCGPDTGRRVVIVGSGPAGLSAAYYLRIAGHDCTVLEAEAAGGGALRYGVPHDCLPPTVLDAEIDVIRHMGVAFTFGQRLGTGLELADLRDTYDAVVLAIGDVDAAGARAWGLDVDKSGIAVDRQTFATSLEGVFAGGNATRSGRLAVRAVAHGKAIAHSVGAFLVAGAAAHLPTPFDCRLGPLADAEIAELMHGTDNAARHAPAQPGSGFTQAEASAESHRCMHCDCRKPQTCRLRHLAEEMGLTVFHGGKVARKQVRRVTQHRRLVYEPGKCIDCGICVRLTEQQHEPLGLAFVGRGFDIRVDVPFDNSLEEGLTRAADACVDACPTGALAWKEG